MKYKAINSDLFIYNRSLLANKLKENSIAIFNSNDIMPTNSDGTMPFKQNSDLFWLTGVDQEESLFAIIKKNGKIDELLFVKETNEHIAIWEGAKLSKDDATKTSGIKNVYWLSDIEKFLWDKILNTQFLFLNKKMLTADTKAATELFMSFAPLPIKWPFLRDGLNGFTVQFFMFPGGTTSTCPANIKFGVLDPNLAYRFFTG